MKYVVGFTRWLQKPRHAPVDVDTPVETRSPPLNKCSIGQPHLDVFFADFMDNISRIIMELIETRMTVKKGFQMGLIIKWI